MIDQGKIDNDYKRAETLVTVDDFINESKMVVCTVVDCSVYLIIIFSAAGNCRRVEYTVIDCPIVCFYVNVCHFCL